MSAFQSRLFAFTAENILTSNISVRSEKERNTFMMDSFFTLLSFCKPADTGKRAS